VWTFFDFEAPDNRADELAQALAAALETTSGWWADFVVGDDHVVVFADRVFRYRIGDPDRVKRPSLGVAQTSSRPRQYPMLRGILTLYAAYMPCTA
jgi:hypothetical protein